MVTKGARRGTSRALICWMRAPLLLTTAVLVAVCAACAEPDPPYGDPNGIVGKKLPNEGAASGGGSSSGSASSGAPAESPFGGPYDEAANKPTITLKASHAAKAPSAPEPGDSLNCTECHIKEGLATAKPFSFGGRVMDKGQPTADAEVVVVEGGEKLGPVKSDADGFFWFPGDPIKQSAKAYVRKGSGAEQAMGGGLPAGGGGCDKEGCHSPGSTSGKIHL
jgi:hypothetical protein